MRVIHVAIIGFVAGIPGWNSCPADVPSDGLVVWLDASAPHRENGDDESGPLASWSDRSGRQNDFDQDVADRRPTLVPGAIGMRPAVRFHGNDLLERADFSGFSIGDQPLHLVIVFQAPQGGPPSQRLFDLNSRSAADTAAQKRRGLWVGFQGSRYIPRLGIHHGDEGEALTPVWDERPHLLELVYRGEQLFEIHVDGRGERRAMFNGTHFLGFDRYVTLAIGQHFGFNDHAPTFFKGDIAEILLYSRPLSVSERVQLGRHLTEKYTLTTEYEIPPNFERDIRPILARHCFDCHGDDTSEADLDLRTVSAMLRGGEAGPVIVRGHPDHSELMAVLESEKMPPDDAPKLKAAELALIRRWIKADAAADEVVVMQRPESKVTAEDRNHWAWRTLANPSPPIVKHGQRVRNDIDRFVLAKLEDEGLMMSPDATAERLARRVYFDLIGLPPSPDELDAFLGSTDDNPFEQQVDRLLESHHFGERWGRHWLDVAGFVDVIGSDNDAPIIKPHPGKWRYRDYVIRSFNQDKPIDRFLTEQLAGDELYDWRSAESFSPKILDALIATGFLLSANDDTDQNELNTPDVRHHVLQRAGENVANALFAVTLQCAKCHDHKYEAISQLDYYRFESVFAPIFNVRNWVVSNARTRPDVPDRQRQSIDHSNAEIDAESKKLAMRRDSIRGAHRSRLLEQRLSSLPTDRQDAVRRALETESGKRSPEQAGLVKQYAVNEDDVTSALTDNERSEIAAIETSLASLAPKRRSYDTIAIATETVASSTTNVLRRGDYLRPGLEVEPELFEILAPNGRPLTLSGESPAGLSGRRLALARAVTDSDSLTGQHVARVFVNRIWQQLFGRGIVETSDNFGVSGSRPSHPELLDWLTQRFLEGNWRVKPLIRTIVLSSAYRQSATDRSDEATTAGTVRPSDVDPGNRLLWRMNLRRLDSEQMRDAMLTVSGKLDRSIGGPPIPLHPRPDGMVVLKTEALPPGTTADRRSVYILARRNYHLTFMRVFDQPIVARNCAVRSPSSVVTQSLALLHDDFLFDQSAALAERAIAASGDDSPATQLRTAWRITLGRAPDETELRLVSDTLQRHARRYTKTDANPRKKALTEVCHMLLNTSEFLYIP